jgi:AmpE protein
VNTLIAIIIALALERLVQQQTPVPVLSTLDNWRAFPWFGHYLNWVSKHLSATGLLQQSFGVLVVLLPIPLLLTGIYLFLYSTLSVAGICFEGLVLFFCLIPLGHAEPVQLDRAEQLTEQLCWEALDSSYAVLFWFALFGPFGALLYRVSSWLSQSINMETLGPFQRMARLAHEALAWLPSRITAFLFALVGRFESTFGYYRTQIFEAQLPNATLLRECGMAAFESDTQISEQSLTKFLDRTLVAWLALIVMFLVF